MSYAIERDRPWRSPELNERNGRIVDRRREGSTLREVGREFGLSGQHIKQIVERFERWERRINRGTSPQLAPDPNNEPAA